MKKRIVRNDPQATDGPARFTLVEVIAEAGTTDAAGTEDEKDEQE
jgi:hypothetical protein